MTEMTPLKPKPPLDPLAKLPFPEGTTIEELQNNKNFQKIEQKKRHNPPILDEDVSVTAFDQAAPGSVKPRPDVDPLAKPPAPNDLEFKIEEGYKALERKFEDLILEVYGSEIQVQLSNDYLVDIKDRKYYSQFGSWNLCSVIIKKRKIFSDKKIPTTQLIIKKDTDNGYSQIYGNHDNPKYNPIAIQVFNQEALDKSKIFAKKYKEMSGQNVRLIQEF
ncbi:hypothetical protein HY837_04145 [archaeon]|nr:hypothetical protein [archaeon]